MTKIKILEDFKPYKKDQVINVNLDLFWRRRLADGSIELFVEPKKSTKTEDSK